MKDRNRWWAVGVVAVVIAYACGNGVDSCDCPITNYAATATGKGVATHKNPADTAARATVTIAASNGGWYDALPSKRSATSYTFTYNLDVPPHGTVTSIQILRGATTVEGTLCSAAPCPMSGHVAGITDTALYRTMRNVGATIRVYTDSDPAGAASGFIVPMAP